MAIVLPKQIGKEEGEILFQKAKEIDNLKEAKEIAQSLIETLRKYSGVGLAAPQIGISKRIFLIDIKKTERYSEIGKEVKEKIFINPKILEFSKEKNIDFEGCLSVFYGSLYGKVERANSLKVEYLTLKGKKVVEEIEDPFYARVFQHEFDHLNGTIFLQRMKKEDFSELIWDEERDIRNLKASPS